MFGVSFHSQQGSFVFCCSHLDLRRANSPWAQMMQNIVSIHAQLFTHLALFTSFSTHYSLVHGCLASALWRAKFITSQFPDLTGVCLARNEFLCVNRKRKKHFFFDCLCCQDIEKCFTLSRKAQTFIICIHILPVFVIFCIRFDSPCTKST